MDLRGFEANVTSGNPVVGATVTVRDANLITPNVTAVLATTTTDANGVWAFSGLSNTAKDIEITFSGQTWRYRGLSRLSTDQVYINGAVATAQQFPLVRNGGFEFWNMGVGPVSIGSSPTRFADVWLSFISGGSTGTITKETTIKAAASDASAKVVFTRVAGVMDAYQVLPVAITSALRGQEVHISAQIRQGVGSNARLFLADSAGATFGTASATTGSFVTLTATRTIDAAATFINVGIELAGSDTLYLDNVALLLGTLDPVYGPNAVDPYISQEYVTLDPTTVPAGNSNTLQLTLNSIVNRLKAATGTTNWYDAPGTTLAAVVTSLASQAASIAANVAAIALKVAKAGDTMTGQLTINEAGVANPAGVVSTMYGSAHVLVETPDSTTIPSIGLLQNGTAAATLYMAGNRLYFIGADAVSGQLISTGTMGTGSGVDADLVDGQHGSFYLARTNHTGVQAPATISPQGAASGLGADTLDGQHGAFYQARANHTGTQAPATISPQGSGSTLDADTLDGLDSLAYARLSAVTNWTNFHNFQVTSASDLAVFQNNGLGKSLRVNGDMIVSGVKAASVVGPDGLEHMFHATEAPEPWFEDFGRARLVRESVVVSIPEDYIFYVDTTQPYYVQIQAEGEADLYVTNLTPTSFEVRLSFGDYGVPFSYRIVARRKDLAGTRLELS